MQRSKKSTRVEIAHAFFLISATMTLLTIMAWFTGHHTQWWWLEYVALASLALAFTLRYGATDDTQNR